MLEPFTYLRPSDTLVLTFPGALHKRHLTRAGLALKVVSAACPKARILHDYSHIQGRRIGREDLYLEIERHVESAPKGRQAFVVSWPTLEGLILFLLTRNRRHLRIFTERSAALAWLNEGVAPGKRIR